MSRESLLEKSGISAFGSRLSARNFALGEIAEFGLSSRRNSDARDSGEGRLPAQIQTRCHTVFLSAG